MRKFPYPFESALAIANDLDNTLSIYNYKTMMDYLNGSSQTVIGKGLGLEIGNSVWFFNKTSTKQVCYFDDECNHISENVPYLRELLKSGHLDTLHTYGNFNEGGFEKKYALKTIEELDKLNVQLLVWTNHGNQFNNQNIGFMPFYFGANPKKNEYHFDILREFGLRYFWIGKMTHILGQDASDNREVRLKNYLQKILSSTKYRKLKHKPFDLKNQLLMITQLQDGNKILEFQRFVNAWGFEKNLDLEDLGSQLKPGNINKLIQNEGFLILYTHMGEGFNVTLFPKNVKRNFEYLASLYKDKILLLATPARLLKYYEVSHFLDFRVVEKNDELNIIIEPTLNTLEIKYEIKPNDLQGVTFYCNSGKLIKIFLKEKELKTQNNKPDKIGMSSISVPWQALEYPN